jgi:hypothetical protein
MYKMNTKVWISCPLNMGPTGCPETSVRNYHYPLCNNQEGRKFLLRGGSLKSHKLQSKLVYVVRQ